MTGDKYKITTKDKPLVDRIKCLNKDELVELLSQELKRGVIKTETTSGKEITAVSLIAWLTAVIIFTRIISSST